MVGIVVFSVLSLLMAFLLGLVFMYDDDNTELLAWIYTICVVLLIVSVMQTVHKVRDYYDKKEYPLTEYRIKKKITVIEENNAVKVDTVCFLVKNK